MNLSDETIFLLIGITIFLVILYFRGQYLEKKHLEEVKEELEENYYSFTNLEPLLDLKENIRKYIVTRDVDYLKELYKTDKITEQMFKYLELINEVEDLNNYNLIYDALKEKYSKVSKYGPMEEIFDDLKYLIDYNEEAHLQYYKNIQKSNIYKGINLLNVVHVYYEVEYNMPYCPKCEKILPKEDLSSLKCSRCLEQLYDIPSDVKIKLRFLKPLKWALFGVFAFLFSVILWSSESYNERR